MSKRNTPFAGVAFALTFLAIFVGIPAIVGTIYFIAWVSQFAVQLH